MLFEFASCLVLGVRANTLKSPVIGTRTIKAGTLAARSIAEKKYFSKVFCAFPWLAVFGDCLGEQTA